MTGPLRVERDMSDSSDSGWDDDEGDEEAPSEAVETVAASAQPQYQAQAFFFNKTSQTYEPRGPCAVQATQPNSCCGVIVLCVQVHDTILSGFRYQQIRGTQ